MHRWCDDVPYRTVSSVAQRERKFCQKLRLQGIPKLAEVIRTGKPQRARYGARRRGDAHHVLARNSRW
jgi:hypothetical protein